VGHWLSEGDLKVIAVAIREDCRRGIL
jgi:hypothetical protein